MIIIGLTGGIASGKSTIAVMLRDLGAAVFDADEVSRQAVSKGSDGLRQIAATFGADYLLPTGELNREKMAQRVFSDAAALKTLEGIIHKIVWAQAELFTTACAAAGKRVAVLDVPLLIECGWQHKVDRVWLVAVQHQTQIERAMARSGMSAEAVIARIEAQMPLTEKRAYADFVINNDADLEQTRRVVSEAWAKINAAEE